MGASVDNGPSQRRLSIVRINMVFSPQINDLALLLLSRHPFDTRFLRSIYVNAAPNITDKGVAVLAMRKLAFAESLVRADFSACLQLTNDSWDQLVAVVPPSCLIFMPMTNLTMHPKKETVFTNAQIKANNFATVVDDDDDDDAEKGVTMNLNVPHLHIVPSDGVQFSVIDALKGDFGQPKVLSQASKLTLSDETGNEVEILVSEASLKSVFHDVITSKPDHLVIAVNLANDGVEAATQHILDSLHHFADKLRVIHRPEKTRDQSAETSHCPVFYGGKFDFATLSVDGKFFLLSSGNAKAEDSKFYASQCMTKPNQWFQFRVMVDVGRIKVGVVNGKPEGFDDAASRVLTCSVGDEVSVGVVPGNNKCGVDGTILPGQNVTVVWKKNGTTVQAVVNYRLWGLYPFVAIRRSDESSGILEALRFADFNTTEADPFLLSSVKIANFLLGSLLTNITE